MEQAQGLKAKGFYRVQITEPDENGASHIVGDSGWHENVIVNLGFNQYLVSTLGAIAGSKQVAYMALGTGTEPNASHVALDGEVTKRASVTAATSSGSKTVRFTATFASSDSFVTATKTLQNIALVNNQNSSDAHTIFCGNTYATSTCAVNQAVNCTYDVVFS